MSKKLFGVLALMLSMTLVACGNDNTPASSKAGGKSDTPSSSIPTTSRPPRPSISVSSTDVVAKDGKVYLQISGTSRNFKAEDFKWALSLKHIAHDSLDPLDTYIFGNETFTDADYNIVVPLAEDGSYVFEYSLTDIQAMAPGMYTITAGPKDYLVDIGAVTNGLNAKDGNYRYYFRHDEEVNDINTLVVDALPPISMAEASVLKIGEKVYAKVGGDLKAGITQDILDAYDSFVQFQNTNGWRNTKLSKSDYYYKIEGDKAYIYADISFFADGGNYNTHLNVTENKQADCKMEAAIDAHYYYKNSSGVLLDINVYSNPNAASDDQSEFWGNLGFRVSTAAEGTEEGPITPAPETAE